MRRAHACWGTLGFIDLGASCKTTHVERGPIRDRHRSRHRSIRSLVPVGRTRCRDATDYEPRNNKRAQHFTLPGLWTKLASAGMRVCGGPATTQEIWVRGSYGEGSARPYPQRARPRLVGEVPLDDAAQRGLECFLRFPAELVSNLARVDGIARVVAGSVGDERHQFASRLASG